MDVTVVCRFGRKTVPVKVLAEGSRLRLTYPFSKQMTEEVKAMEGSKAHFEKVEGQRDKFLYWSVSHCDRNLLQLMVLSGNPPTWYQRYLDPEPARPEFTPRRPQVKPHQLRQLRAAAHVRRLYLVARMGTGKSLTAIELMEHVNRLYPGASIIYVAPPKPLVAVQLELVKWKSEVHPTLITYDGGLKGLLEAWPKGKPAPRMVVFDECHNLANPGTKRYENAEHLVTAMRADHRDEWFGLFMTGTPTPNNPCQWHPVAELVCPGFLREANVHKLRKRIAIMEQAEGAYGSFPKILGYHQKEVELLGRRLEGLVHVTTQEEANLNLPPPAYETISLPPSDEVMRAARVLALTSGSAIELLNQLRQLSDGFQYRKQEDGTVQTVSAGSPKDQALLDLLERHEASGRFLVYAAFTASIDKCVALVKRAGWQVLRCDGRGFDLSPGRYTTVNEALLALQEQGSDEDRLAFCGQPGAGGSGLNMQGVSAMCFYSNDFNAGNRWQAECRPQRPGNCGLTIYDLVNLPTDLYVAENLRRKEDLQKTTIDEIRKVLG